MDDKTAVRTEAAPAPFQGAPYSQAIRAGGLVFVSGQLALKPGHAEIVGETIEEQTEQVFANLRRDPRGGGQRARPAREDDGLPDANLGDFAGDERGLRAATSAPAAGAGDGRGLGAARPARKVEIEAIALAGVSPRGQRGQTICSWSARARTPAAGAGRRGRGRATVERCTSSAARSATSCSASRASTSTSRSRATRSRSREALAREARRPRPQPHDAVRHRRRRSTATASASTSSPRAREFYDAPAALPTVEPGTIRRGPVPPRLHDQRDGRLAEGRRRRPARRPVRRPARPRRRRRSACSTTARSSTTRRASSARSATRTATASAWTSTRRGSPARHRDRATSATSRRRGCATSSMLLLDEGDVEPLDPRGWPSSAPTSAIHPHLAADEEAVRAVRAAARAARPLRRSASRRGGSASRRSRASVPPDEVCDWLDGLKVRRRDARAIAAAVTVGPKLAERLRERRDARRGRRARRAVRAGRAALRARARGLAGAARLLRAPARRPARGRRRRPGGARVWRVAASGGDPRRAAPPQAERRARRPRVRAGRGAGADRPSDPLGARAGPVRGRLHDAARAASARARSSRSTSGRATGDEPEQRGREPPPRSAPRSAPTRTRWR